MGMRLPKPLTNTPPCLFCPSTQNCSATCSGAEVLAIAPELAYSEPILISAGGSAARAAVAVPATANAQAVARSQ